MKLDPQTRKIFLVASLADIILGAYLILATIDLLPFPFIDLPDFMKWVGLLIFAGGTAFFIYAFVQSPKQD